LNPLLLSSHIFLTFLSWRPTNDKTLLSTNLFWKPFSRNVEKNIPRFVQNWDYAWERWHIFYVNRCQSFCVAHFSFSFFSEFHLIQHFLYFFIFYFVSKQRNLLKSIHIFLGRKQLKDCKSNLMQTSTLYWTFV
jgi:hypothetical protein